MPQINFSLGDEADEKIIEYSKKWKLSKPDTILKIIKIFEEKENGDNR